ncbi:MAG: class I SAM-dependent rRNA methyltransferase [Puniceicoccales bacterium]|nr:class I SAM-dependent rRNA methyltransferase [Puniceicoccales bacterium]
MSCMITIRLKSQGQGRVLSGHPWAFAGEILPHRHSLADGDCAELYDAQGRLLGSGLWSGRSQIAWRRYSFASRPFDEVFIAEALRKAVERRLPGRFRRLVWSEADHLPGLVVDQFDGVLAVQALTAGVDRALPIITSWLSKNLGAEEIILRNDAPSRVHDGLALGVRTLSGRLLSPDWFRIEGVEYLLDLAGGQKTGFYLDQREQHLRVARLAQGRRVLDGFCNQGGFALQAARMGASSVLAIDSSEDCTLAVARNASRNSLDERIRPLRANMFDWFTQQRAGRDGVVFDLIVLDPPPFARNREAMDGALRGYKEINLRAMHMLAPGGILATYSCSQRVNTGMFMGMLGEAAVDTRRTVRVLEVTGQPMDHPVLLNFPESHYLKGAILQVE